MICSCIQHAGAGDRDQMSCRFWEIEIQTSVALARLTANTAHTHTHVRRP